MGSQREAAHPIGPQVPQNVFLDPHLTAGLLRLAVDLGDLVAGGQVAGERGCRQTLLQFNLIFPVATTLGKTQRIQLISRLICGGARSSLVSFALNYSNGNR